MVGVSSMLLIILTVVIVNIIKANKNYKEEINKINKKEYKLITLMSLGLLLYDRGRKNTEANIISSKYKEKKNKLLNKIINLLHKNIINKKVRDGIYILYGRREYEYRLKLFFAEKIAVGLFVILGTLIISLCLSIKYVPENEHITKIKRPDYGTLEEKYTLKYEFNLDGKLKSDTLQINIQEKLPSSKKIKDLLQQASNNLPQIILGNNRGLDSVSTKLNLIKKYPGTNILIEWESNTPKFITNYGEIRYNQIMKDGQEGVLTATLIYGEEQVVKRIQFNIYKQKPSISERLNNIKKNIQENINNENANLNINTINLPKKSNAENINIKWYKINNSISPLKIIIIGLVLSLLFITLKDYELKQKIYKRNDELKKEFPEFTNKLILLINAGLNLTRSMEKISSDYKEFIRQNKTILLYEELIITMDDIENGVSEITAYEQFGRRCQIPEILRFTSSIIQNVKKGNEALVDVLRQQSKEIWDTRVSYARKLGEKASSKLILPMGIVFIIILLIVMTPVYLSMKL